MSLVPVQVYCLPDGYEVVERSLDDIRYVLNPTFTAQEIARLDKVGNHSSTASPVITIAGQPRDLVSGTVGC